MTYRKKLIEVALPLEAINKESAHEKAIRVGHPSNLHLWWARRPLVACRAVIFASLVDDPSEHPERFPTEEDQKRERQRLFRIIERLVQWKSSSDADLLNVVRAEISKSVTGETPPILDPFCGGGSIPLEAQRLGLQALASDLNPVAVLITKAMIELPYKFAGHPPINRESRAGMGRSGSWSGTHGLAEDVRYYGSWMRDEALRRIGHLFPTVQLPRQQGSGEATVVAWLWARTVRCPNPACGAQAPLVSKFELSHKAHRRTWIEPEVSATDRTVAFRVRTGDGDPPEGTVNRKGPRCVVCGLPIPFEHVRREGRAGRIGAELMAIAADGPHGRVYLPPVPEHAAMARAIGEVSGAPDTQLPARALGFRVQAYGMTKHRDLFTPRQLVTLSTLNALVGEARSLILADYASLTERSSRGATNQDTEEYADAVATYLALAASKLANRCNALSPWMVSVECPGHLFTRQAISMSWDFAEANAMAGPSGSFASMLETTAAGLEACGMPAPGRGSVDQLDATEALPAVSTAVIVTDPPYYDNIGYGDLSDFFYVWLRTSLGQTYPGIFSTLLTPKTHELVAAPERFDGDARSADKAFEEGLYKAFRRMRTLQHPDYPLSIYYAFKQTESPSDGAKGKLTAASSGWATMLEGLIGSGFTVTGTWPIRSERAARTRARASNAIASSIVLVCRPRREDAPLATHGEFVRELKRELPVALRKLQEGSIAPVDLAQAAIGPGMAVFSRYVRVLEADGSPMQVRTALGLINQVLDEVLAEQESEYDPATRWALAWFDQHGMEEGNYGDAETLATAKNVSVSGLVEDGFLWSRGGKVRLLRRDELPHDWDPSADPRFTVWEATQHLLRALEQDGEGGTANLMRKLGSMGETARDLAYRLYTTCERKKWVQEALGYNSLVVAWPEIAKLAAETLASQPTLGV